MLSAGLCAYLLEGCQPNKGGEVTTRQVLKYTSPKEKDIRFLDSLISVGNYTEWDFRNAIAHGQELLPILIDNLDRDLYVPYLYILNPFDSYCPPSDDIPIGMKYAYLVEYILADKHIPQNAKYETNSYVGCNDSIEAYRLINANMHSLYGVIIRNTKYDHYLSRRLIMEDMIPIKGLYKTWWEKQQGKSIREIREEWEAKGILNSRNIFYKWI